MSESRFNLKTMSGIHPGTRAQVFQRLQLISRHRTGRTWATLMWFTQPSARVLTIQSGEKDESGGQTPSMLTWETPEAEAGVAPDFLAALGTSLVDEGWQLRACGSCRHWQPLDLATDDDLPAGRCTWRSDTESPVPGPARLRFQSALALGCEQWEVGPYTGPDEHPDLDLPAAPVQPTPAPDMNLRDRVKRLFGKGKPDRPPRSQWTDNLLERSGVGAGTESCFVCQGRIANLGAIAVATDENDKRTFSVWRCRTCGGFYLNDWTDRWERLDNLETEERYFRLAPGEALSILALINQTDGPEHPAARHQRDEQRRTLESFIADRAPLSHQIRQGR